MSLRDDLFKVIVPAVSAKPSSKLSIVGTGEVGMACAVIIAQKSLADELVLVDRLADRVKGESMDLMHGSLFMKSRIKADTDLKVTQDSNICIVCAGVRVKGQKPDSNQLNDNVAVFKEIIPQLAKHCPSAVLLIVTQPVDLLTYVAWKLSGFPKTRVIGVGTNLDTARLRFLLGTKLNVNPTNIHTYIVGEQGYGSVTVWSGTNVAGIKLRDVAGHMPKEQGEEIHKRIIDSGQEVIRLKGCTSWAIGLSVANIVNTIVKNLKAIQIVTTNAKNEHGIKTDVFISLPCILGATGVCGIIRQQFDEDEARKLSFGVENLTKAQCEIGL
ncbi:L-lactate dehydrogenase B chain-like [Rhinoraja longicauda]